MCHLSRRTVVAVVAALCLGLPAAGATAAPRHQGSSKFGQKHHPAKFRREKLPADYAAWSRVAVCEEGGWYAPGGNYPDALGIDATNWYGAGGKPQYGHLSLSQRIYEIKIADRFIHSYRMGIPDQGIRCAAW